jgi:hypothetical protein
VIKYINRPDKKVITKAAFSFTTDLGFESGGGVVPFGGDSITPEQNFFSVMFYNRIWFGQKQTMAWTIGGGTIHNPGRYLALLPPGNALLLKIPEISLKVGMFLPDFNTCQMSI